MAGINGQQPQVVLVHHDGTEQVITDVNAISDAKIRAEIQALIASQKIWVHRIVRRIS
jgi:ribosomal protein L21